jgi:hypothetical protein
MARAYMLCLQNTSSAWLMPWRRRQMLVMPAERALYYLSEVLLRSYQVYLPYSQDIWRSVHAAYRLVESHRRHDERVEVREDKETVSISVSQRYRRLLLLGIANPYQMPFGECVTVHRFLERWVDQASLLSSPPHDASACFLVDLSSDMPPKVAGHASTNIDNANFRWLDIAELTRTLHGMLRRLEKGESATSLQLGIECLDSACHDMFQRLHRVYGQAVSRRHSRIKRHETVMICAGIGALHFFASGQKPFVVPEAQTTLDIPTTVELTEDETYVPLDEPGASASPSAAAAESFRVDRWHVHDVSPQGLMLSQEGKSSVKFRIGDLLGVQRMSTPGHWSVGLVRWCKALGDKGMEVGVELIAPDVEPASVTSTVEGEPPQPALMLPAVEATKRLASVVVARGKLQVGNDCFLEGADHATRRVRIIDAIERTNSIEQVVVGNVR